MSFTGLLQRKIRRKGPRMGKGRWEGLIAVCTRRIKPNVPSIFPVWCSSRSPIVGHLRIALSKQLLQPDLTSSSLSAHRRRIVQHLTFLVDSTSQLRRPSPLYVRCQLCQQHQQLCLMLASSQWKVKREHSTMAGYDTGTITMNVPQHEILRLSADRMDGGLGAYDHDINFEGGDLLHVLPFLSHFLLILLPYL